MPTSQPIQYDDPLERRTQQIIADARTDEEFMAQVRSSLDELARGERGRPLSEIQHQERAEAARERA